MAYPVSDLYKEAIDKESRVTKIDGELVTVRGTRIPINNATIDQGSFYITNQCVSSDAFAYGSVFAAEAGITLKTEVDRYSLFDAEIRLYYSILLSNNEYERIPLGVFYVNEPSRVGKNITIKAYDGMIKLNETVDEDTIGTAHELLTLAATKCGVELAQTEEELATFVNGDIIFSLNMGRVDTYRDLVSYIAQVTCSFAIFDREGKLKLCKYEVEPSKIIPAKLRTSSKFSDFETYFSSASAYFISNSVFNAYAYTNEDPEAGPIDGLLYEVGEVPIVQGLDDQNQQMLNDIFTSLSDVRYTPSDFTFNGDPSIELGDKVINIDRFGNEIESLVTFYKWTYRGSHQIKSAGTNPKLASVKEKKNSDLSELQAQISAKTVSVYTYTNSRAYTAKGGTDIKDMASIIQIAFAVKEDVNSIFMATVNFEMDIDGFVEFHCYLDGLEYENSRVAQYCLKGKNTVTFMNYFPGKKNKTYRLEVLARTYYEETDARKNEAIIQTNENARHATIIAYQSIVTALKTASSVPITSLSDSITYEVVEPKTTVPTMKIAKFNIKASIFGQGLAGKVDWDGTLLFNEFVTRLPVSELLPMVRNINDEVSITQLIPGATKIGDRVGRYSIGSLSPRVKGLTTSIEFGTVVTNYTVEVAKARLYEYNSDFISTNSDGFRLRTTYGYESTEYSIDSGRMSSITLKTDDKITVEGLVI